MVSMCEVSVSLVGDGVVEGSIGAVQEVLQKERMSSAKVVLEHEKSSSPSEHMGLDVPAVLKAVIDFEKYLWRLFNAIRAFVVTTKPNFKVIVEVDGNKITMEGENLDEGNLAKLVAKLITALRRR